MSLGLLLFVIVLTHTNGLQQQIVESNDTGSWSNWFTGYRVNDRHDGYLDIGNVTFNAVNLELLYTANINCTSAYSLFANGRIYCDSNNMLFSYHPQNGSLAFWYKSLVPFTNQALTFATAGNDSSIFMYSCPSAALYVSAFDAFSGGVKGMTYQNVVNQYSTYPVGTEAGDVYFTSKYTAHGDQNSTIYAYNVETNEIRKSNSSFPDSAATLNPIVCHHIVAIADWTQIVAYNVDNLEQEWIYLLDGISKSIQSITNTVCIKNEIGYRIIVRGSIGICYMLNAENGELITQFECTDTTPIFHYSQYGKFADIGVYSTGETNQIVVAIMNGDQIIAKQLWYGEGNIRRGFTVDNYFVTTVYASVWNGVWTTTLNVKIYGIYNGYIYWEKTYQKQVYSFTYSVFAGLVQNEDHMDLMMMIRVGNQLYAYKEPESSTSITKFLLSAH